MANPLTAALDANSIEALRQSASEAGDCLTSSLANEALWSPSLRKRAAAKKRIAKLVAL